MHRNIGDSAVDTRLSQASHRSIGLSERDRYFERSPSELRVSAGQGHREALQPMYEHFVQSWVCIFKPRKGN